MADDINMKGPADDGSGGKPAPRPDCEEAAYRGEMVLLTTADDSFSAETYKNLLTENGIHVVLKAPKAYLQKFINIGYTKFVSVYVQADKLDDARALLDILRQAPFDGDAIGDVAGYAAADASNKTADIAIDAEVDKPIEKPTADTDDSTNAATGAVDGPAGGLRDKKSVFGFIFLLLILLLPTVAAVISIIGRLTNPR